MRNMTAYAIDLARSKTMPDVDSPTRMSDIVGVAVLSICLVFPSIIARVYVRTRIIPYFGIDDVFVIISGFFVVAAAIYAIYTVIAENYGTGQHLGQVTFTELRNFYISVYVWEVGYSFGLLFIKIAILTYYNRLQPSRLCQWTIVVVVTGTAAILVAQIVQCWPISKAWDPNEGPHGTTSKFCLNDVALSYFTGAWNILSDFWIWGMAIRMLRNLQVSLKKKIEVILIFSLGLSACGASIARICTVKAFYDGDDPTWEAIPILICSFLELTLAIVAANLPTLKPGWVKFSNWAKTRSAWSTMKNFFSRIPILSGRKTFGTSSTVRWRTIWTTKFKAEHDNDTPNSKRKSCVKSTPETEPSLNGNGLAEVGRWGLQDNDFCHDLEMQHVLPPTLPSRSRRNDSDIGTRYGLDVYRNTI